MLYDLRRADALALAFMTPPSLQIWTGYEPFLLNPRPPVGVPVPPPSGSGDDNGDGEGERVDSAAAPCPNFGVW